MVEKEYDKERRRQTRLERRGSNEPQCLLCDENDPCCLERHHVAGKIFGDDCVTVCRNHHRKLSDKQKDHPPVLAQTANPIECWGRLLLGVADALELLKVPPALIDLLRQAGEYLINCDQTLPPCEGEQP
jgi:hypothetical protein